MGWVTIQIELISFKKYSRAQNEITHIESIDNKYKLFYIS